MVAESDDVHPLADLYGYWALNPLVEIARVLSFDVALRPQHYRVLAPVTSDTLVAFRYKVGTSSEWPDTFQRTLNFKPLYQVALATPPVREAALRFMEAPSEQSREAFRLAAGACRDHLRSFEGHGLTLVVDQVRAIFSRAISLFRDPAIGRRSDSLDAWPLGGNFSPEAAHMIAQHVRELRVIFCLGGSYKRLLRADASTTKPLVPLLTIALPAEKFLRLQRAAFYGRTTLSMLLSDRAERGSDTSQLGTDELISAAYQWTKALQSLVPDVARAWKDVDYRCQLTDLEWGMAPNPSGELTPATARAAIAFSTSTVHGEICCCSGDLDCDPTSQLSDFCSEYQCPA